MDQFYTIHLQFQILIRWSKNTAFRGYGYICVEEDHPQRFLMGLRLGLLDGQSKT